MKHKDVLEIMKSLSLQELSEISEQLLEAYSCVGVDEIDDIDSLEIDEQELLIDWLSDIVDDKVKSRKEVASVKSVQPMNIAFGFSDKPVVPRIVDDKGVLEVYQLEASSESGHVPFEQLNKTPIIANFTFRTTESVKIVINALSELLSKMKKNEIPARLFSIEELENLHLNKEFWLECFSSHRSSGLTTVSKAASLKFSEHNMATHNGWRAWTKEPTKEQLLNTWNYVKMR